MEEEGKRIEREKKLSEFRIGMFELQKAEAERILEAANEALLLEQKKSEQLGGEEDKRLWAEALEAGKMPNYIAEERQALLERGADEMKK